jgi:hypothetical protein
MRGQKAQMKFRFLTGDVNALDYGAKFVSKRLHNGDFNYWLVMELINMTEACGRDNDGKPTYHVCLSAVSPEAAKDKLEDAFASCGDGAVSDNPLAQVECLHSYGISSPLWQGDSNNAHKLMRQARQEAIKASSLFGFYMDAPKNRIGTTGWEAIKGDLDSGLARTIASGTPTGNILAKMHGIKTEVQS